MCGIAGVVHFDGRPVGDGVARAMADAMVHRGPDDQGLYASSDRSAALAFRRLSIIDLRDGGQPMRRGGDVIVFNGEIYNYRELRRGLESAGERFVTQSDTEVLLALLSREGPDGLKKTNGMFAFALWSEARRELLLGRDRLGIKPLYYFYDGKNLAFASEIKSLLRSGETDAELDPEGVGDFFSYRFVPGPRTVLKRVRKVMPGRTLRIGAAGSTEKEYWSLDPAAAPVEGNADALLGLLDDAVRAQLVSDVPLGAFLSGGVDSSLVTALMVRHAPERVKTFSIGFEPGTGVDESAHARRVAEFLGTEHHSFTLTEKDMAGMGDVLSVMNEPVADPTVLPTAILSGFARRQVKVALTGEGGDELFAGYNRYKAALFSGWVRALPGPLRPLAAAALRRGGKGAVFRSIPEVDAGNWFLLNRDFSPEARRSLLSLNGAGEGLAAAEVAAPSMGFPDAVNRVLDLERRTSLVDRLLMKVDMASMGRSLEARPPFLDHRVVEWAFRLPSEWKIRGFKGKHILRQAARRLLPKDVCWRKKHGFIVPLAKWMTAGGADRLDEFLDEGAVRSLGAFNVAAVRELKDRLRRGEDTAAPLWPVLVLTGWMKGVKN